MYLGFYSFYKHYNRNRLLDDPTGPIGDDILYGFFFAGCAPVSWGAPDVADFIPARAFIDMRNFKGCDELYRYLKAMPEPEYQSYLAAIEDFVRDGRIKPFTGGSFANVMLQHILQPRKTA